MQGGHRASVTHIITQVYEAIESTDNVGEVITKLKQCNIVLQEILDVARQLNNEILDLVDKNELEEFGLADEFRVKVCRAITDSTKVIEKLHSSTNQTHQANGYKRPSLLSQTTFSDH